MGNGRIFVTGSKGYIGSKLIELGCSPLLADVTDGVALDKEISLCRPLAIIHLASKSGVDFCESPENSILVDKVNFHGSSIVFEITEKHNIPVVFVSSDHIFSGDGLGSYKEESEDIDPKNVYGKLKFFCEGLALAYDNVKVVRTSTVVDRNRNIVSSYLKDLESGKKVYPPVFIWRSFIHRTHFCYSLIEFTKQFDKMPKILNIAGSKNVSWWRLIQTYAKGLCYDPRLVCPRFTQLGYGTPRPLRAGLSTKLSKSLEFVQFDYTDAVLEDC